LCGRMEVAATLMMGGLPGIRCGSQRISGQRDI